MNKVSTNMSPIWPSLNHPRLTIGSAEARQGSRNGLAAPKMSRDGPKGSLPRPKMAELDSRWGQHGQRCANMGPKGA